MWFKKIRKWHHLPVMSLIISPAMIKPTTEGTNAVDPGISLLSVHFLAVPGGQMQCCLQLIDISSYGLIGFSLEYTTLRDSIPLFLHSRLITLATTSPEKNLAKTMWKKAMEKIHEDLPESHFKQPAGIVTQTVCASSGLLQNEGCPGTTEIFDADNVPMEHCDVHYVGEICDIDNKPAAPTCPYHHTGYIESRPQRLDSIASGICCNSKWWRI